MSKKSNNPFVSISDLMASVTAIVILLLVVSIVKSEIQQMKAAEEKAKAEQEKIKGVNAAIIGIKNALQNDSLIQINTFEHTIILQDASFKSGSACLSSEVGALLDSIVAPQIISTLRNASYGNVRVQIEGHTDPVPVGRMSISEVSLKEKCALFDDNYTL
ncbi:MAG: hypothetical protein HUK20_04085, partial [Fibrobacter sp.]|nr:hypothetical protein [Fibrobacter sp.]